ncbi:MAG: PP2C family protein-serine/threonine phosphatase [Sciscionella sp.]
MTLVLRYVARSDRGLVRSNNQDSVYAGPRLLAVADGMGGHAAGEVASKVVIAALAPLDDDEPGDDLLGQLRDAVDNGNAAISELVADDPELDGMGTTLTAILFSGSRLGLLNIGDSRTYLFRSGTLTQITHDDTFVQSLIDEGRITPEEASSHPQRSLLLRALTGHEIEPSLTVRESKPGDRYLLCSDGLSGVVSYETLVEAVAIRDPQLCADRMIELALKGGGPDNVTVIIADVVDVDYGEDAPIVGGAAGDGSDQHPTADSPAARAQAITAPPPQPQRVEPMLAPPDPRMRRRKRMRWLAIVILVLVVLAGAALGTRWWVMQQYYIGVDGAQEVAIFQGVHGSILGVSLHSQVQGSCAPADNSCEPRVVTDFTTSVQETLRQSITGFSSVADARRRIVQLELHSLLPKCNTIGNPQGTTPPSGSKTSGRATPTGSVPVPPTPTGNPADPTTAEPGMNCREAH